MQWQFWVTLGIIFGNLRTRIIFKVAILYAEDYFRCEIYAMYTKTKIFVFRRQHVKATKDLKVKLIELESEEVAILQKHFFCLFVFCVYFCILKNKS